jgi:glycosyltransferase involved in cell wall biosynthesis
MRPLRVLYLTLNPNRQSTTVPTEGWFTLLRDRGLEPVLVSRQTGEFQRWALGEGVPTYENPLPFPDRRAPGGFAKALERVVRIGLRHRVDLVHSNEHDVYPIAQYAARLLGVPKLVSVHFTMERGFCEWAFGRRRGPDRMFFVSNSSQDVCREGLQGVVPESRWRVLRNGLDLSKFRSDTVLRADARRAWGIGPQELAVGVACALRPRKQLEHLFHAVAHAGVPVKVVVAGGPVPGDEVYAARLVEQGRALLGDRLHAVGHVDDLRGFYNGLDLFVNTSREEACSISVIESLACGCPVVGYASRSVDEQILPDGGEISPQDDTEALASLLRRWLTDSARLGAARAGARRQAERLFDIRSLALDLWHEYQLVLGRSAA